MVVTLFTDNLRLRHASICVNMRIKLINLLSTLRKVILKYISRLVKKIMNKESKNMSILEAQEYINKLAREFFAIGENATEDTFRSEFAKLEKEHALWQWMNPGIYGKVIITLVYFTRKYGTPSGVIDLLDRYYPDYDKVCSYDYQNKVTINEAWARSLVELDVESKAYEHLKIAAYNQFVDNISYDGFEFFSFRDFTQYAFDDIQNNTICLAHPSTFNDPMDTILLRWNKYLQDHATDDVDRRLRMLYQKVYDHIKVRCFVRTDTLPRETTALSAPPVSKKQRIEDVNPLMWAHYANYHKGFCIKYKFPGKLVRNEDKTSLTWTRIGNVNYVAEMVFPTRNYSLWDALFAKHDVWQYEKEVRLIHYDPSNEANYKTIEIPEDCIEAIYLGLKCLDENREKMKLLLRNRNIRLYQMKVDDTDSYKLVKERIF